MPCADWEAGAAATTVYRTKSTKYAYQMYDIGRTKSTTNPARLSLPVRIFGTTGPVGGIPGRSAVHLVHPVGPVFVHLVRLFLGHLVGFRSRTLGRAAT